MSKTKKKDEKGTIRQGTIAGFMRKRTQLVGFEFGYWKHTQYCAEFLDNALDAIESFQWKESKKEDSNIKFTLDQELSLENLSILQKERETEMATSQTLNDDAKHTLMQEFGLADTTDAIQEKLDIVEKKEVDIVKKEEIEIEEEVKKVINDMEEIIKPVENIIDVEPIVIIRLREYEAASFLTSEISQKNVMGYTFEIFDNGTGMSKTDLKKFGKYLASSKSMELKQTRGSQGFGAPSAFSDAQNTTGKPIVTVSKSAKNIYATVSEFFTTSKNEKRYLINPTEIDCPFLHGTYIKLHYLNVKYVRGYVDIYVKETALMNPHITIIYIDPYGEEFIYPRKVSNFPEQPKYAKAHPSSTNIGDLQDLLVKSENLTISAFLQDNFVRISSKTAKQIINLAERDLQDKLKVLILKDGYSTIPKNKTDDIYFLRFEKRVFGRSNKPRNKLIIYKLISEDLKNIYWEILSKYNQLNKKREKINKEVKKLKNRIDKAETKKEIGNIEREIKSKLKGIDEIRKEKDKIKVELNNLFKDAKDGITEQKKLKNRSEFEDLITEVEISKAKPNNLTSDQFNSLFLAFKSIKYMAPPTDTAIPVGETVLENTLIKELGLKISENLDDFDTPVNEIITTTEVLKKIKINQLKNENLDISKENINNISVESEDVINFSAQILSSLDINNNLSTDQDLAQIIEELTLYPKEELKDKYQDVFEYFIENFSKEDDFVAAETRDPTSGKGLAYVVEAVMAYSKNLETPKRSRDILSRFVNRTPKLRDSADCAITKAVQAVNWKNYKLEVYDNGLPKGPIKLLVNVSGPFVHLMFKSQSKNALADDEDLIKEIKYCLEAIGRRLRVYLNRRLAIRKSEKRASVIEKYIPKFVSCLYNIASQGNSKYREKIDKKELENRMREAIRKKAQVQPPVQKDIGKVPEIPKDISKKALPKEEEVKKEKIEDIIVKEGEPKKPKPEKIAIQKEIPKKELPKEAAPRKVPQKSPTISRKTLNNWTVKELRDYCNENNIKVPSKIRKAEIINLIQKSFSKEKPIPKEPLKEKKVEPVPPGTIAAKKARLAEVKGVAPRKALAKPKAPTKAKISPPKAVQTQLPVITSESILNALSKSEWQTIKHLIFKLKIKDMMDARFLQIKLKDMERKGLVLVDIKTGKKHWKLK